MIINTDKIRRLLDSESAYSIEAKTGITRASLRNYANSNDKFNRMSLDKANALQNYYDYLKGEKDMYKLTALEEGNIQSQEYFDSFEDLKQHLITEDYFGWTQEQEPEKELPDFKEAGSLEDIEGIFDDYDYSWWRMEVEKNG